MNSPNGNGISPHPNQLSTDSDVISALGDHNYAGPLAQSIDHDQDWEVNEGLTNQNGLLSVGFNPSASARKLLEERYRDLPSESQPSGNEDGGVNSRRSVRQQDRVERLEAQRILAENQKMLEKEKQIMKKNQGEGQSRKKAKQKPLPQSTTTTKEGKSKGSNKKIAKEENSEKNQQNENEKEKDENDPEKLWCICRQPHNNRFMICCDECEEWFHGHCVGVTRAQGKLIEDSKSTWICPGCKKSQKAKAAEAKGQTTPTPASVPISTGKTKSKRQRQSKRRSDVTETQTKGNKNVKGQRGNKKDEICSGERSEVTPPPDPQGATTPMASPSTPNPLSSPPKPSAPTIKTPEGTKLEKKETKKKKDRVETVTNPFVAFHVLSDKSRRAVAPLSSTPPGGRRSNSGPSVGTTPTLTGVKRSSSEPTGGQPPKRLSLATTTTSTTSSSPSPFGVNPGEGMRKTLKQVFEQRSGGSSERGSQVAAAIEQELFNCFQSLSNVKCKNKYRSILFNLRDGKNNLWEEVLSGRLSVAELVNMDPTHMASQELAQWRMEQNQMELNPIKKAQMEKLIEAGEEDMDSLSVVVVDNSSPQGKKSKSKSPSKKPKLTLASDEGQGEGQGSLAVGGIATTQLTMQEIGKFSAILLPCSHGKVTGQFFPPTPAPIVGRIEPTTVWEYIDKLKKNKEMIIFQLAPASDKDKHIYDKFFHYFTMRKRFGVVGGIHPPIKDVYLIPLPANEELHPVLLPFDGPGLGGNRTNCLIVVVTRQRENRRSERQRAHQVFEENEWNEGKTQAELRLEELNAQIAREKAEIQSITSAIAQHPI